MKLPIVDATRKKAGERELPAQFSEAYRPDLIKRAVLAIQSAARQRYGASPMAGLRHSVNVSKRRRDYKTSYGFGISRVARKVHSHRGTRMNWIGAFSPQTVGGRRAHPPKAIKIWEQKINDKERQKAIRSAIAATVNKTIVTQRGHKIPMEYPFLLPTSFEQLNKTKDVAKALLTLGFEQELQRGEVKKVRAGKGKWRGRRYHKKKSLLIVVGGKCPLLSSVRNIAGVDIVQVQSLNAELLAPGAMPGRATLWTESAVETLQKQKLFN
ncbi:50S ribosomal protein L4 [Candidatus Woesearchaeota archaeon]|nr:50S ribosomal protein L4 [Candidatus Woesearchaeota archaeon]